MRPGAPNALRREEGASVPVRLSLVIPVYNEEAVLLALRRQLEQVFSRLVDVEAEVVFVDDGSDDRTSSILSEFVEADARYKCIVLSRNCGHQAALTAGLDHASGEVVVIMDADLQDPPELIPRMLELWRKGFDVVYGQRTQREGESFLKRGTAHLFYQLLGKLAGVGIPRNTGDFRLLDRKVVEALKQMPERFRFIRGMVSWVGFRQVPIPFDRPARRAGTTKYPWRKMVRFAFDAIFSFSVLPLRITTFFGLIIVGLSVIEIVRTIYLRIIAQTTVPGFSAIFVAVLFLGGLNLLFLGIIGEYIGRIYGEVKGRPLYIVKEYKMHKQRGE